MYFFNRKAHLQQLTKATSKKKADRLSIGQISKTIKWLTVDDRHLVFDLIFRIKPGKNVYMKFMNLHVRLYSNNKSRNYFFLSYIPPKLNMQWVQAENCSIECPAYTICKRPMEFLEPLYCVHRDFRIPEDLLKDPSATTLQIMLFYWPFVALFLLMSVLALQVCFF